MAAIDFITTKLLNKNEITFFVQQFATDESIECSLELLKRGNPKEFNKIIKPLHFSSTKIKKVMLQATIGKAKKTEPFDPVIAALFCIIFISKPSEYDKANELTLETRKQLFEKTIFNDSIDRIDQELLLKFFALPSDTYSEEAYQKILETSKNKYKAKLNKQKADKFDELVEQFDVQTKKYNDELTSLKEELKELKKHQEKEKKELKKQHVVQLNQVKEACLKKEQMNIDALTMQLEKVKVQLQNEKTTITFSKKQLQALLKIDSLHLDSQLHDPIDQASLIALYKTFESETVNDFSKLDNAINLTIKKYITLKLLKEINNEN